VVSLLVRLMGSLLRVSRVEIRVVVVRWVRVNGGLALVIGLLLGMVLSLPHVVVGIAGLMRVSPGLGSGVVSCDGVPVRVRCSSVRAGSKIMLGGMC